MKRFAIFLCTGASVIVTFDNWISDGDRMEFFDAEGSKVASFCIPSAIGWCELREPKPEGTPANTNLQ